jgi:hypothetical protein
MTDLAKPSRRGRKPRKPIRAKGRKRTSNRRKEQLSLKKQCAILWARWIKRNEKCEFIGQPVGSRMHLQCGGGLQAMHGFGKKAYPGVRYAVWNGFSGCGAVHAYYSWRPPEWENYLRSRWGEELYQQRLSEAMLVRKYDLATVAQTFRAALAGVEL